ncbi:PHP domain protein [Candidatus Moduliflexus flocculans]|uniref:PHP domain protein n=1 Tax=Candidatus Moduliflexus flocculans TaxID=1499966 RepID=A0A0S6VSR6_9BACT|nr:PHP domain protein [Candidatus Moduliflexus flocculans]
MKADLHIHSYHSDGKYSPAEIVFYAAQNHLDMISLTDHDTIDGLADAQEACRKYPSLTLISGVELSTYHESDELHILGYGIDPAYPALTALLEETHNKRQARLRRVLARLQELGVTLTYEEVDSAFHTSSLGRMHVARLMIERGYVRTIREAFDRYLSYETNQITYTSGDFISSQMAIETIAAAGGISIFAHPTIALFDRYLEPLVAFGLRGIEIFKGSRPSIEEFYLETVVKDKGLLTTGGSDWHGYHQTQTLGSFYVNSGQIQRFLTALGL